MAQQDDLKAIFAKNYPHLAPLADELEQILSIISTANQGYGDVKFTSQGKDARGNLQIKYFDTQLRQFRKKTS
jgi:hypothetical protein